MESDLTPVNDLVRACSYSSEAGEWEELLRRSLPLVSLAATRVCRVWLNSVSRAMVDDIAQEVFLKLCEQDRRILREFVPRGEDSFFGLLRTVTVSVANDYMRRISSAKRGGKVVTFSMDDEDRSSQAPTSNQTGEIQRSVLFGQLDGILNLAQETVGERDRIMFWLYYRHGFTADEISRMPEIGLSAKGVESALRRVSSWLRAEVDKRKRIEIVRTVEGEAAP